MVTVPVKEDIKKSKTYRVSERILKHIQLSTFGVLLGPSSLTTVVVFLLL